MVHYTANSLVWGLLRLAPINFEDSYQKDFKVEKVLFLPATIDIFSVLDIWGGCEKLVVINRSPC